MRKTVHEARFAMAVHSKYAYEADASGHDAYRMFNPFDDDSTTAWDRCRVSAHTRFGIGLASIGLFEQAEYTLEDAIQHQDKRKKEAMQEEGEDVFRQDQFTSWYHLALARMRAAMKHEEAFGEALKKVTALAAEAEEAHSNGKLM